MSIELDNETYLTIAEACDVLGGITSQTLRTRTAKLGIPKYRQAIAPNVVYYKKKDIEGLLTMRQVEEPSPIPPADGKTKK